MYIEVRPKYLLPDTNCFIDCLEDFKRIVNEFKRYTLIVPLTGKTKKNKEIYNSSALEHMLRNK